nr:MULTISPECIES: Wzz/FepE/Etk N-terminal domain-containing protein [unclassified Rhodococcus (in: high G+C Gram-positive bacteria)]
MKTVIAGWRIIAVSIALSMATAFGISSLITPVYESRTQMFVSTSGSTYSPDVYEGNLFSQQAIPAYAGLVINEALASTVIADLALDLTPAELADKVTMTYSPETVVFDIVATDTSPAVARDIANTMATELSAVVADLEARENGEPPSVMLKMVRQAEVSDAPILPNTRAYLVGGAAVGLIVGTALVLVRHRSNGAGH